jgi:hypothetical protein
VVQRQRPEGLFALPPKSAARLLTDYPRTTETFGARCNRTTSLDIEIKGEISMPLTRDKIVGHDRERLAFTFLMLNGNEAIECRISEAAMDALAGERGRQTTARQAQFLAHRDAIEQIASDLFDVSPNVKGYVIRIFTKHVPKKPVMPDSNVTD